MHMNVHILEVLCSIFTISESRAPSPPMISFRFSYDFAIPPGPLHRTGVKSIGKGLPNPLIFPYRKEYLKGLVCTVDSNFSFDSVLGDSCRDACSSSHHPGRCSENQLQSYNSQQLACASLFPGIGSICSLKKKGGTFPCLNKTHIYTVQGRKSDFRRGK